MNSFFKKAAVVSSVAVTGLANQIVSAQAKCSVNGKEVDCAEIGGKVKEALGAIPAGNILASFVGLGVVVLAILLVIFWTMMLVHAINSKIENKLMWILAIVFTGLVGAGLYYFIVKRKYQEK
jgi:hypothetical protein